MKTFLSTTELMFPIMQEMLDEMCLIGKIEESNTLGSWQKAVTTADGTWQTRGYHSKNATFRIRNYFSGALL